MPHVQAVRNSLIALSCFAIAVPVVADNILDVERKFGFGIGPFHFGMPFKDVNSRLPHPAAGESVLRPTTPWWKSGSVTFFSAWLHDFPAPSTPGSPFDAFKAFESCWAGNGYAAFLFAPNGLIRMSVRFFADCANRNKLAADFASSYSIAANQNGALAFRKALGVSTVEVQIAPNVTTVEVYKTGSEQPAAGFFEQLK